MSRALGVLLVIATYIPVHRLLGGERAGPAGAATRAAAEAAWTLGTYGTMLTLVVAVILARVVPGDRLTEATARAFRALVRPSPAVAALVTGATAFMLSLSVALAVFDGLPTSVDEMAQLLHARAIATGALALPVPGPEAAWIIQNGIVTPDGWASIYPPFHTVLLAIGLAIDAPWLVGPTMVGVATGFATLSFERLMGAGPGRAAGGLLAVTPFWLFLGGTHLSHTTAAAALAVALYCALRAASGRGGWALAAGAAVGAAVCTRPWIAIVSATALLAATWLAAEVATTPKALVRRAGLLTLGGAPFAMFLFWWNARLFGHPLRLGYSEAFGPAHGLGLHVDPWGNAYGIREAVGYTAADLVQLGAHLLESPLPSLAIVGIGLCAWRGDAGRRVWTSWVFAAIGANALYWHHGVHLGPRMLFESTPAWIALAVGGTIALTNRLEAHPFARGAFAWSIAVALLGATLLTPSVVGARRAAVGSQPPLPEVTNPDGPVHVFVHGSWASRIAARLAADGMRRDSIETALRRNDVCAVDRYARWRAGSADRTERPSLQLEPLAGSPTNLVARALSQGNPVRVDTTATWDATCLREAGSDRFGVMELEPLLWRVPRGTAGRMVVLRDLGPAANALVRSESGGRSLVYLAADGVDGARLLAYDEGMELLWRGAAGASTPGGTPGSAFGNGAGGG